jgi:uncharacterized protein
MTETPPGRVGRAVAATVAVLVVVNVVDVRVAHASLVLGPAGAAGLLALARWAGLSWQELGLGAGTWRRGLVWALGAIGAVGVVFAVGAALPLTRDIFRDSRYHLFEEVAFRGVLWGLLRRGHGTLTATIVSSVLFGLWHVLPSLHLSADNQAIGSAVGKGTSGEAISVLGTVLFTGLAGVVFCELRRRSGSLLASAGLHWATNGLGVLTAAAIWAWASR